MSSASAHSAPARRRDGSLVLQVFAVIAIGLIGGLGSAAIAVNSGTGFGRLHIGGWTAYPKTGTFDIDPYARAAIIRRGDLPLGVGEGMSFSATADRSGLPLNGQCSYMITGQFPAARAWTLTAHAADGAVFSLPGGRSALTSGEVVRSADGAVMINAAHDVQAGNWLPLPDNESFTLVLRLYDLAVGISSSVIEQTPLPQIGRVTCRN